MWIVLAILVLLRPATADARQVFAEDGSPTARCLLAANAAGVLHGVPDGLMERLAQVESGRPSIGDAVWRPWPWTINADGAPVVFESQGAAIVWAAGAARRGIKFLDAGCLQVNLQYHPAAFADLSEAFDPWMNARYAAIFLRSLYDSSGHDWSMAVGWYHSQTPELAYQYRTRVAALGEGIIAGLPPEPLAARLRAIGMIGVPLAGGGMLRVQFNRQPSGSAHRRPSPCALAAALGPLMVAPPKVVGCRPPHRVAGREMASP